MAAGFKIYYKYGKLRSLPNFLTLEILLVGMDKDAIEKALKNYLISNQKHLSVGIYSKNNLSEALTIFLEGLLCKLRVFQISVQTPNGQELGWHYECIDSEVSGPWKTVEQFLEYLILHSWTMLEGQDETGIYYYDIPRTVLIFVQDKEDAKDVEAALDKIAKETIKDHEEQRKLASR